MNHFRSRAARPLPSSAALQTTVAIALFALLAVFRVSQHAARATAQTQTTQAQEVQIASSAPPSGSAQNQTSGCVLTLADLERMAMQANPTLAEAQAAIRAAEGRRVQAGLWPNPVIGYTGEEFSTRAFGEKSEHFAFVEQTILLGGKLGKSRRIFAQEKILAEQEAVAQQYRILNTVRMLFYEAMGAQRRVETRAELVRIARAAVGVTEIGRASW